MSRSILKQRLITEYPTSTISDAYRSLRANIEFSIRGEALQTISVTSALPGEGKSTVTASVAVAYAQTSRRVLIIDADLRKPAQHELFGLSNRHGLSTALTKRSGLNDVIQRTNIDHLEVLTAGPLPSNPSELLESISMTELLETSKERFDIVFIDTPSIMTLSDALVVASKSDGVVLVMKAGKVKNEILLESKAALDYGQVKIIGAVLNNVNR
ncbi:CpsD/CapB family tyrosine-protein kinase [Paenibacillus spongiae]|uniref:non-specific protein-tyrosine kinase n=1 Tax=Paenibacillus spongiae TaxID=2909671 RepID=A0ABY5S638_9BACL|nr:CpsD/CapB family tyrosine-protein kinase [Paenibacillus spongiae]UVI29129.1 CpsD/CapB family tyrosine-protein kinase [Paenibacillus spongiae]